MAREPRPPRHLGHVVRQQHVTVGGARPPTIRGMRTAPMPMSDAVKYVVSCFPRPPTCLTVDAFDDETIPFRLYYFGPFAAVVGATHETGINAEVKSSARLTQAPTCRCGMTNTVSADAPVAQYRRHRGPLPSIRQDARPAGRARVNAQLVLVDGAEHGTISGASRSST